MWCSCRLRRSAQRSTAGDSFSEVESTKSVSDIYAPVVGNGRRRQRAARRRPGCAELAIPYGAGWICEIEIERRRPTSMACSTPLAIKLSSTVSRPAMAYVFCNQCGHRNPPDPGSARRAAACSTRIADHTITIAQGRSVAGRRGRRRRSSSSASATSATGVASLIVRSGAQAGDALRVARSTSPASAVTPTARSCSTTSPCRVGMPRSSAPTGLRRARRRVAQRHLLNQSGSTTRRVASRRRVAGRQVPSRVLRADRRLRHEHEERPYLSIGEVLGLLLEEFPDVTISKIRFLESQGLIDPERTASRLPQVLRQRRRSAARDPARAARELPAAAGHSRSLGERRDRRSDGPDNTAPGHPQR